MPQRRNEHERLDLSPADINKALAKVDLQLPARRRLKSRRRKRLGPQRLPVRPHRTLQRPPAHF
jgi:hypothetical protein